MALQKSLDVLGGQCTGTYWKIVKEEINRRALSVTCIIQLFKDKAASDSGAPCLYSFQFNFKHTKEELAGDVTELLYADVKAYANEVIQTSKPAYPVVMGPRVPQLAGATDI